MTLQRHASSRLPSSALDIALIEGKRVAPGDRVEKGKQVAIFLGKKVNFDIHLAHPLAFLDEAQKVLGSVFYLDERDAEHRKPELRRTRESIEAQNVYDSVNIAGVPPRPVYTPEPEFSERARKAKFQGVVVLTVVIDTRGEVSSIKIDRGLGLGLDEKALDGLKKWRFTPATRNGEPVNTRTQVEIDFHLY